MRPVKFFRAVGPYLTAVGVMVLVAVLLAAIYFTLFDLQWIAFLAGILVAAILAMVGRASRAEWTIARRTAQLKLARDRLALETERRKRAEEALARISKRVSAPVSEPAEAVPHVSAAQEMFDDSYSEQVTGWSNAADRLAAAIEKDEFRLYCQRIVPLESLAGLPSCYEIFIRLVEEEENLMPPGAFLPLAEKYGLMPELDRWVVRQLLKWASARDASRMSREMLFINVSRATISDPDFPEFVAEQRRIFGIPGEAIGFELDEPDVTIQGDDAARFVAQLRKQGCHAVLSGFGRDRASFDLLRRLDPDFIKIDGSVIMNMLRNPLDLAKVTAINRAARAGGVRTIAEHVESDETVAKLRAVGVDFAQGFGISEPCPIEEIKDR